MQQPGETDFAIWYRRAHPGLVESVLRAVQPRALAEDAADEAFARAFGDWERVQAMRSPVGWVYRVAVNAARRQVANAAREAEVREQVDFVRTAAGQVPPPGGEAWLLVGTLPIRQRTAVVLRHVAGLTEMEIGAAMGVARSTVSSSLAAAYRSLARQLDEPPERQRTMQLELALARACGPDGCDVETIADGASRFATYGDAVRDTIKVRPGDLVALDNAAGGRPVLVWRWWGGTVERIAPDGSTATVSRNVTQSTTDDPRRADLEVGVPDELRGTLQAGETVWFGSDGDAKVVVAAAGPELRIERAAAQFPTIQKAYEPGTDV